MIGDADLAVGGNHILPKNLGIACENLKVTNIVLYIYIETITCINSCIIILEMKKNVNVHITKIEYKSALLLTE